MTDTQWTIGGNEQGLTQQQQLAELCSYLDAHYEKEPADNYYAKLPDRITHASMLLLGSAVDHSMPGVAYTEGVESASVPELNATRFTGSAAGESTTWVISLHPGDAWRGDGAPVEMQWRPEVAAVANLAGVVALDVDYSLAPDRREAVRRAIAYARDAGAQTVVLWGYAAGAALAVQCAADSDALVLTFPDLPGETLPDDLPVFIQVASEEDSCTITANDVREYVSRRFVSTPEVARQRIVDVSRKLVSIGNWQEHPRD
ncbi:alpha/beta hydrolase [Corynebacterium massiliense]|uniref:Alpha/beta hydrolase n=1 Tax=Corynebacterium massiliense DSM 45435 TaxID=1121364 RepID=A0ABY7U4G0_9CORY|nr:alpha/beta hydrolase [Corynebacterium massiliense]WCZ31568.1 hypothetical protein CMASS_00485 [Corynebacterium massiliense DSM 45435]